MRPNINGAVALQLKGYNEYRILCNIKLTKVKPWKALTRVKIIILFIKHYKRGCCTQDQYYYSFPIYRAPTYLVFIPLLPTEHRPV